MEPLLKEIEGELTKLPPITIYKSEELPLEFISQNNEELNIVKKNGTYFVTGSKLHQLINSINFDDYESLQYFQKMLISTGVIDALNKAGVVEGDTVNIYDFEFDFVE